MFFSEFFSTSGKLVLKLGASQFLKMKHIPASGHQFFLFFERFFKVEAAFLYCANLFFNILFIWLVEADFLSRGNSVFSLQLFFSQWKPLLELWTTDFLASGNLFFETPERLLPVIFFSGQWESIFQQNLSFGLVGGNRFQS